MTLARRSPTVLLVAAFAAFGALQSSPVRADDENGQGTTDTEALFARASKLLDQGRFAEARPDLEEVARREPHGIGAKMALAECRVGEGKLASAWTILSEAEIAARATNQPGPAKEAKAEADKLAPRLSRLTITVPGEIAAIPGLVIHHDALAVTRSAWGLSWPVDGGAHVITAIAPGKREWRKELVIPGEGGRGHVKIPLLEDAPAEPPPAPVVVPVTPSPAAQPPLHTSAPNVNAGAVHVSRKEAGATTSPGVPGWAWGVGAAGLALLGGAVAFRVDQGSASGAIDAKCPLPGRTGCEKGYDFSADRAREVRDFDLFLGLGIGGIVAVGASVVGIVTAPTKPAPRPAAWTVLPATLARHGAGLAFTTRW